MRKRDQTKLGEKSVRGGIPVVSLFSGCGGMDLGFEQAGFVPIIALDNDQSAINSYNKNRNRIIAYKADLSELSGQEIIDLIQRVSPRRSPRGVIGGPPCQSFSHSNVHGKPRDPRHNLPLHYAEILKALNKKFQLDFFVFENVIGLKSRKHKSRFARIRRALEEAGFNLFESELDAVRFRVPQNRRRVFVVGINKDLYPRQEFSFPAGRSNQTVKVEDVIANLPDPVFYSRSIRSDMIPFHPNHWTMNPKSAKFGANTKNNNGRSFRKLSWDKPSWTVAYGHREIHVHPNGTRRLSIFEAMLLQGFPENYQLAGNFTEQVVAISNAVPPPLAYALAREIRETLYDKVKALQSNLLAWFRNHQRDFPWRHTRNPYNILIAEKLLQQTAATKKVVSAYNEVVNTYPTVNELAKARVGDLERIMAPLGLTYRARELLRLATELARQHDHVIPNDLKVLLKLPGVGDYAARALLSFAFGDDVPIVDTNVARFLHRIFGLTAPMVNNPARNRQLIHLADTLVPRGNSRDFNLAVLDLCSIICTTIDPDCAHCPIYRFCQFGQSTLTKIGSDKNDASSRQKAKAV